MARSNFHQLWDAAVVLHSIHLYPHCNFLHLMVGHASIVLAHCDTTREADDDRKEADLRRQRDEEASVL